MRMKVVQTAKMDQERNTIEKKYGKTAEKGQGKQKGKIAKSEQGRNTAEIGHEKNAAERGQGRNAAERL
ncbi:hypothetical protein U1Q18_008425 [Sarracenia purpurea var. burkii]